MLKFDEKTNFSIKVIGIVAAAAISWGIVVQKVEDVREDVVEVKESVAQLDNKIDEFILSNRAAAVISSTIQ